MNQQRRTLDEPDGASVSAQRPSPWRTGAVVFAVAAITDLAILGVATRAGADMLVTPAGGRTMSVGIGAVLLALLVTVTIGTLALTVMGGGRATRWRLVALVGSVAGVVSLAAPLTADATIGTTLALSSMHVAAALIWLVGVRHGVGRRRASGAA